MEPEYSPKVAAGEPIHTLLLAVEDSPELDVRSFVVEEALSEPLTIRVVAMTKDDVPFEAIVGSEAIFAVHGARPRFWSTIVRRATLARAEPSGLSTYEIELSHRLSLLAESTRLRVFQDQSLVETVGAILAEHGVPYRLDLDPGAYPRIEYRVQWGESDLELLHRLLCEAGVGYFFAERQEPSPGRDELVTEVVLTDRVGRSRVRAPALPFVDTPTPGLRAEVVTAVTVARELRPGRVVVRDVDDSTGAEAPLESVGEVSEANEIERMLERHLFIPGAFRCHVDVASETPLADERGAVRHDQAHGDRRARLAAEGAHRDATTVAASTNAIDLMPGDVIEVERHPHPVVSGPLLVVRSILRGAHDEHEEARIEAIPATTPFRPAEPTARRRIYGFQRAVVVGPPGRDIHTDEHGRVRVQFPWDRSGAWNDQSSCWMRVSQPWAGVGYGMLAIPRVGHEVLVAFADGDPDQPMVVGRLHNELAPVPYALPANQTKTVWRSRSTPSGAGFNELSFDDADGAELLYIRAEKDLVKLVKGDQVERTGGTRATVVEAHRVAVVGGSDTVLVGDRYTIAMAAPGDLAVAREGDPTVKPGSTGILLADDVVRFTTGRASLAFEGPDLSLVAEGNITIRSERGTVDVRGGPNVHINRPPQGELPATSAAAHTGLGSEVDDLVRRSPTLAKQLAGLEREGYGFAYGDASHHDATTKEIVVDERVAGDPGLVVRALSHEAGHALNDVGLVGPGGLARADYIVQNVRAELLGEADAEINRHLVAREILGGGGPDILLAADRSAAQLVGDLIAGNVGYDEAREALAAGFAALTTGTTGETYADYYARVFSDLYSEVAP